MEASGHKVEEFYWAGRIVVYVDGNKTDRPYEEACKIVLSNHPAVKAAKGE